MKKKAFLGAVCAATLAGWSGGAARAQVPPRARAEVPPAARAEVPAEVPADSLAARLAPVSSAGLTADQVARRAEETSFDAAARRQALAAAEARLDQAQVAYYPKLTLTANYTRLSDITQPTFSLGGGPPVSFPFPLNRFLFQAGLNIPVSDYVLRLSQSYAAASRSQRAAQLDQQAAKLKAATDGKLAYYAWLRAKGQVTVAERSLEQSKAHYEDARHQMEVGTSSKADLLRVESQVASAELVVERAKNVVSLAEEQLRVAMHDPSDKPYEVGEDLRVDPAPLTNVDNLAALRAEALERRLEVRALDETSWSLREQAKAARAGYYPRLDIFGNAVVANPNPRVFIPEGKFRTTWEVGAQLVWTPNDSLSARGQSGDAEARASQTEMQKEVLRDSLKIEVMQAYNLLHEADVALQTTRRGLTAAEEGYRVRRELFRNGRATSVELSDSELELFRASLEAINARVNWRSARASLIHAIGRDIPSAAVAPVLAK
jgi:outer membrane protein TolC